MLQYDLSMDLGGGYYAYYYPGGVISEDEYERMLSEDKEELEASYRKHGGLYLSTDPEDGIMENNLVAFRRDVRILDATIRDGGIVNNFDFSDDFVKALLQGDLEAMNVYMNEVTEEVFSSFDSGKKPSRNAPERFYHGFVLGLLVDLQVRYIITSNRESGFGRYDVMLEPREPEKDDAIILEFKVHDPEDEATLKDTVQAALEQIEEKQYKAQLTARGIPKNRIRSYGFAFEGKKVLIG